MIKNENALTIILRTLCFKIANSKCLNNNLFYIISEFMFIDMLIYSLGYNELITWFFSIVKIFLP